MSGQQWAEIVRLCICHDICTDCARKPCPDLDLGGPAGRDGEA